MSIIVDNISYIYEKGTGFERQALKNVSCAIEDGNLSDLLVIQVRVNPHLYSILMDLLNRLKAIYITMAEIYMSRALI